MSLLPDRSYSNLEIIAEANGEIAVDQAQFRRRIAVGGVALLMLLLVLLILSTLLFLSRQRAIQSTQLALNATGEILPLLSIDSITPAAVNDPLIKESRVSSAISYLEALRISDPENLKCLVSLRTLYNLFGDLLRKQDRLSEAQEALQKADSMVLPIALSRLRSWKPTNPISVKGLPRDTPFLQNNDDRIRLQTSLAIAEQANENLNVKDALNYAELATEYLLLLDTSTKAGRLEARRVLVLTMNKFQQVQATQHLSPQQEELVTTIKLSLDQL